MSVTISVDCDRCDTIICQGNISSDEALKSDSRLEDYFQNGHRVSGRYICSKCMEEYRLFWSNSPGQQPPTEPTLFLRGWR